MPSPFPGMDPYLEAPDVWPDFHNRLATIISAELNAILPAPYYARLEMRLELGVIVGGGGPQRIVPDVMVVTQPLAAVEATPAQLQPRTVITDPMRVTVRMEPIRHYYVEVRDAARGHQLTTLLEIVSPSNKGPGPDRDAYERKQHEIITSNVSLIELDLLRTGQRILPHPELHRAITTAKADYVVLINRASNRRATSADYEIYPIQLHQTLPCIPIPLRSDEVDVPLDLQVMVNQAYDSGPYRRIVSYREPPDIIDTGLDEGYRLMALDEEREAEALEWSEANYPYFIFRSQSC